MGGGGFSWSDLDPTSSDFMGGYGTLVDPLNFGGRSGGKKSTPAPPDFTGAAQSAATQGTWANRPNQTTPWGSMTWTPTSAIDPSTGMPVTQWSSNLSLTPEQQAIFESQQRLQGGRSQMAENLLGNASDALSTPVDFSGLPQVGSGMEARNAAEQAIYGRRASRLDPMWQQREDQARTRLYNMGLREGDQAFTEQMANLGRERTDAYDTAMREAIMGGGTEMSRQFGQDLQARQQGISELLSGRNQTLNELQALLSGQQVGQPQMPGFMPGQAPNLLGAAGQQYGAGLDAYNAQQGQMGNMVNLLAMLGPLLAASDERLKTEIHRFDYEVIPGVPFASWKWKTGGKGYGVIAQDLQKVRPDLVHEGPDGYLLVDYGGLR